MDRPLILVVEDNPTEQRIVSILLDKFGYNAHIVNSGAKALEAIQSNQNFDLILMDWQMEDMNGLECSRRIRQSEQKTGRHVPIIAVTARVLLGDRQKCMEAGMDDYLSKPYTATQFEQMLSAWTSRATTMTG